MVGNDSEENHSAKCSNCNVEMQSFGTIPFRIGGGPGWGALAFGPWTKMGESMLPFDVYACPRCGKVELHASEAARELLLEERRKSETPNSFLKICVKCGKSIPIASEECQFCGSKQPHR
jgi:ribosomal protein L40E